MTSRGKKGKRQKSKKSNNKIKMKDIKTQQDADKIQLELLILDDGDYNHERKEDCRLSFLTKFHGLEVMEGIDNEPEDPVLSWHFDDGLNKRTRASELASYLNTPYLHNMICKTKENLNSNGRFFEWDSTYKNILKIHDKIVNTDHPWYYDNINWQCILYINGIKIDAPLNANSKPMHATNGAPAHELIDYLRDVKEDTHVYHPMLSILDDLSVKYLFVLHFCEFAYDEYIIIIIIIYICLINSNVL